MGKAAKAVVTGKIGGRADPGRHVLKQAAALLESGEAPYRMADEAAAGFAQSHAILYLERVVSLQAAEAWAASQCEQSLFLIRSGRPSGGISIGNLARKTGPCHPLSSFSRKKLPFCNPRILGQKVVSAASSDSAPNEIANWYRFG